MTTDLDRLRTDAIISIHQGSDFDFESYISQLPGEDISKEDMATMLGARACSLISPISASTDILKQPIGRARQPILNRQSPQKPQKTRSPVRATCWKKKAQKPLQSGCWIKKLCCLLTRRCAMGINRFWRPECGRSI